MWLLTIWTTFARSLTLSRIIGSRWLKLNHRRSIWKRHVTATELSRDTFFLSLLSLLGWFSFWVCELSRFFLINSFVYRHWPEWLARKERALCPTVPSTWNVYPQPNPTASFTPYIETILLSWLDGMVQFFHLCWLCRWQTRNWSNLPRWSFTVIMTAGFSCWTR